jgi:lysozyme family protein
VRWMQVEQEEGAVLSQVSDETTGIRFVASASTEVCRQMADFEVAFEKVLLHEGGYIDDDIDPGGETKYGISKSSFPHVDIPSLTIEDAKAIYREVYWKFEGVDSQEVANKLLDMAVQFGLSRAVRLLQNILHINSDGKFGPISLTNTNHVDPERLLQDLRIECAIAYCQAISKNTSLIKYARGWMRRAFN